MLADNLGVPCVALTKSVISTKGLRLVPDVIATDHCVLPIAVTSEAISLAVCDDDNSGVIEQVSFATGRQVHSVIAIRSILEECIATGYAALTQGAKAFTQAGPSSETPSLAIVRPPETSSPEPAPRLVSPAVDAPDDTSAAPARLDDQDAVFVIEDDPDIRHMLVKTLQHDGYRVIEAADGTTAITLLRRSRPALVLLDAMLPGMHGFEICAKIKSSAIYRDVPVIMISAVYKGWETSREIQEVHRADAFVEKPFEIHFVRKLVAQMLGKTIERPKLPEGRGQQIASLRRQVQQAFSAKNPAAAIAAATRWRDLDPFDAQAYISLGTAHAQQGAFQDALGFLERAVVYDETRFPPMLNLAIVYEKLGFQQKAAATWRRALALTDDPAMQRKIQARLAS